MEQKKSKAFLNFCKKIDVNPDNVPEVMSFEAACKDRKVDPKKLPVVTGLPARHRKFIISGYKLAIIAEAIRGGKTANYNDTNETKYFPVFKVKADSKRTSGFGLSYSYYGGWGTDSSVGVQLCFPNWDMQRFFAERFLSLHKDYHLYT